MALIDAPDFPQKAISIVYFQWSVAFGGLRFIYLFGIIWR